MHLRYRIDHWNPPSFSWLYHFYRLLSVGRSCSSAESDSSLCIGLFLTNHVMMCHDMPHWHSLFRYMEAKGQNTWGYLCALFHVPETYCDLFSWTTQSCRILRSIMFNDYNNYLISNDSTPINIQQGHGRLIHKLDLLATVLDFIKTTNSDKYQAHSLLTAISKITFWTL